MISNYNLNNNVLLLGKRDDCDKLYNAMDIFVLPSLYEGLPLVALEAQGNGLPCILSNTITTETRINDNVYYKELIIDEWKNAINELINEQRIDSPILDRINIVNNSKHLEEYYDNCLEKIHE